MSTDPLNTSLQSSGKFSVLKHFSFLSETCLSIIIALHDVWKLLLTTIAWRLIGLGYCLHRILWYQHIYFFLLRRHFNSHIWEKINIILFYDWQYFERHLIDFRDQFGHMLDNAGNYISEVKSFCWTMAN